MMIGLFFFIRASTKDRTETLTLKRPDAPTVVLQDLTRHFRARAYEVETQTEDNDQVSFRGMVRPSVFLAAFLTTLAAIGLICLAVVLTILFPGLGVAGFGLLFLAPAAGLYYWQRARREEQVMLKVYPAEPTIPEGSSLVTVTAHRDELIALQQAIKAESS